MRMTHGSLMDVLNHPFNICTTAEIYTNICCSNQTFTFVLSVKMSCTEIPAFQIPQENPEEDDQIPFQWGITKRTG